MLVVVNVEMRYADNKLRWHFAIDRCADGRSIDGGPFEI